MLCCGCLGAQEGHEAPAPQRVRVRALDCRVVQAPPRRAPTQFRAVAFYGSVPGALQDEHAHLSELHRRQGSRGLEVAVATLGLSATPGACTRSSKTR
ncbi:MAG: hypothetical protein VX044_08140 [Planctomycetota bacterium]|nr:hypothetical protein [Planctomycetota bacterium]